MASLQDQLLKAGLIDKGKAQKVSKQKQKAKKTERKTVSKADRQSGEQQLPANAMQARNAKRDRQLNQEKQQVAEQKAIQAQIRQLIELNKIDRKDGELAYNFADQKKVKTLYITAHLQVQLGIGRLAIVRTGSGDNLRYELVAKGVAEKIAQRDADCIIPLAQTEQTDDSDTSIDDPYSDFKVPDDLMW